MSRLTDRERRSRPKRHLNLDLQDIVALRHDGGDRKAFERILAACHRWVSEHFSRIPSFTDCEEIVDTAILAVLEDLLSHHVSCKLVRRRLERQLEEQRISWEEHAAQLAELAKEFKGPLCSPNSPEDELHLEFWMDVVREIEHCMFPALLALSEDDRSLLAQAYGLDEMSDPSTTIRPRFFPSESARRAALYRARGRFSKHLESMLNTALEVQQRERCLLEAALRIVRGKAIAKAITAVRGLKRER